MHEEKKQQAKELYLQSGLNKSQVAAILGISRRSLHYWVREGNWERLKDSAEHMPALIAENCYHILGHLTRHHLSDARLTSPITHKEADTMHKLATTINKLKNRSTPNEDIETFTYFLDALKRRNPNLAAGVAPYIEEYLSSRVAITTRHLQPAAFSDLGRLPIEATDPTELHLDNKDLLDEHIAAEAATGNPFMQQYLDDQATAPAASPAIAAHDKITENTPSQPANPSEKQCSNKNIISPEEPALPLGTGAQSNSPARAGGSPPAARTSAKVRKTRTRVRKKCAKISAPKTPNPLIINHCRPRKLQSLATRIVAVG